MAANSVSKAEVMDLVNSFNQQLRESRQLQAILFLQLWPDLKRLSVDDPAQFRRQGAERWRDMTEGRDPPFCSDDWNWLCGLVGKEPRESMSFDFARKVLAPAVAGKFFDWQLKGKSNGKPAGNKAKSKKSQPKETKKPGPKLEKGSLAERGRLYGYCQEFRAKCKAEGVRFTFEHLAEVVKGVDDIQQGDANELRLMVNAHKRSLSRDK